MKYSAKVLRPRPTRSKQSMPAALSPDTSLRVSNTQRVLYARSLSSNNEKQMTDYLVKQRGIMGVAVYIDDQLTQLSMKIHPT